MGSTPVLPRLFVICVDFYLLDPACILSLGALSCRPNFLPEKRNPESDELPSALVLKTAASLGAE